MGKNACVIGDPETVELLGKALKAAGYTLFIGLPVETEPPYHTWNRRSPISTRALVTEALRSLKTIDDVILVFDTPGLKDPFGELSALAIETSVDNHLKGPFFLIREFLNILDRQGGGALHVVLTPAPASAEHPVDSALRGALVGFLNSLFTLKRNDGTVLHGFQAMDIEVQEYVENIVSAVTNRQKNYHGRWHRSGSNPGILSSLPFGSRKK